jgi:hypothetical protein
MRGNWLKGLPRDPSARDLARIKVVAHAAGFEIKTKSDALGIIHLADMFRGILRLSHNLSTRGGCGESPEEVVRKTRRSSWGMSRAKQRPRRR